MNEDHRVKEGSDISGLGVNPVCSVCGKPLKPGQHATQIFTGIIKVLGGVDENDEELVVEEGAYNVFHTLCEPLN